MTKNGNAAARLEVLARTASGKWWDRIHAELGFARAMIECDAALPQAEWDAAAESLCAAAAEEGAVTRAAVLAAEEKMPALAQAAKAYKIFMAAHAHIDMNWMWGYHETVDITLETFRTMLRLMDEYPKFTFSQSQASTYRIVERHEPSMLEDIRKRVKEGRWEVTASDWVEADKNMTSAESCVQHLIQAKTYLSELLDLPLSYFDFCFEPDTFGHNQNIPMILAQGGIKYYYHCRGNNTEVFYNWQSPSGDSILVYREPDWYLGRVNTEMAVRLPKQCRDCNSPKIGLEVYGVGDHGGGPTRADLNLLLDMQNWPVYPVLEFGTFRDFFRAIEPARANYPTLTGEQNFVFTGCYTSQTRIKLANRVSERKLGEASALRAMSNGFLHMNAPASNLDGAWRDTLFNHFHDILPGSGVLETREYALGLFQGAIAEAGSEANAAIRAISAAINTSGLMPCCGNTDDDASEGAGVGYGLTGYGLPHVERGRGKTRAFTVFNPTAAPKRELVTLTVFDWHYDKARIAVTNAAGGAVRFEVSDMKIENESGHYWGHTCFELVIEADVAAMGYETYLLTESAEVPPVGLWRDDPRVNKTPEYVLENEHIRAVFATDDFSLTSLVDKATGSELLSWEGGLCFAQEDCPSMSSWTTGRFIRNEGLGSETRNVRLQKGGLRQWLRYDVKFENSDATVTVSLDAGSRMLAYHVRCDWREFGSYENGVPALRFELPLANETAKYVYDIPYGVVERSSIDDEVPGLSFGAAVAEGAPAVMLTAKTKYGFRGFEDTLGLALIRGSYDPDPLPENYRHEMEFAVGVSPCGCANSLLAMAAGYNNGLVYATNDAHTGVLAPSGSFMQLAGEGVRVDTIVPSRDGRGVVVRLFNTTNAVKKARLIFAAPVQSAYVVDFMEEEKGAAEVSGCIVMTDVAAFGMAIVRVTL